MTRHLDDRADDARPSARHLFLVVALVEVEMDCIAFVRRFVANRGMWQIR